MECPNCKQMLEAVAGIPDEQRFTLKLEFDGQHLSARTLGGSITNMEKLLKAIAKDAGTKVEVMVENVVYLTGSVSIIFVIVAQI